MKIARNPSTVHAPLAAYAQQIELRGDERLLLMAGQVGITPEGDLLPGVDQQLGMAMDNVLANLREAGMGLDDLVKLTFYYVDEVPAERRREILERRLGRFTPCMTLVYVPRLATPEIKVEIDAWASS